MEVGTILLLLLLRGVATQERTHTALVGHTLRHGDDGIEKDLEVGLGVAGRRSRHHGGKMASGRESHHPHVVAVEFPRRGVEAHEAQRLLSILHGHLGTAVGQTILEDDGGNALVLEILRPVVALLLHGKAGIAAARTDHHRASRGLLVGGQEDAHLGRVLLVAIAVRRFAIVKIGIEDHLGLCAEREECHPGSEKKLLEYHFSCIVFMRRLRLADTTRHAVIVRQPLIFVQSYEKLGESIQMFRDFSKFANCKPSPYGG